MNAVQRIATLLSRILVSIGSICLLLMMILACANMVLRGFLEPIKGTYELMGYFGALLAGFGMASTQLRKGHIALTIVSDTYSPRTQRIVEAFSHGLCGGFFLLMAWQTCKWALSLAEWGELSQTLYLSYYPVPLGVGLGIGAMALILLCDMIFIVFPPAKEAE